jgi:MtN3 and saliva related transmembrane protein
MTSEHTHLIEKGENSVREKYYPGKFPGYHYQKDSMERDNIFCTRPFMNRSQLVTLDTPRIIGLLAGILTTSSLLPQLIRTLKTKSAKDLSLGMFLLFVLGIVCWLTYGIMVGEWPIIAANVITLVMAVILLVCKIKFG